MTDEERGGLGGDRVEQGVDVAPVVVEIAHVEVDLRTLREDGAAKEVAYERRLVHHHHERALGVPRKGHDAARHARELA